MGCRKQEWGSEQGSLVIMLHGGGFRRTNKREENPEARVNRRRNWQLEKGGRAATRESRHPGGTSEENLTG